MIDLTLEQATKQGEPVERLPDARRWEVTTHRGMAGRWEPGVEMPGVGPVPRYPFGRNWWHWWPRFNWNGGVPWEHAATDVSASWLCFTAGVTLWVTRRARWRQP